MLCSLSLAMTSPFSFKIASRTLRVRNHGSSWRSASSEIKKILSTWGPLMPANREKEALEAFYEFTGKGLEEE